MRKPRRLLLFIPVVLLFSLILLAIVGFFGLEYYATTRVKQEIDYNIKELSQYMRIEYDSLKVNWLAFTVYLTDVRLSKPPLPGVVTIDKVSVRDLSTIGINWIPTVVSFDHISLVNEMVDLDVKYLSTTFTLNEIPTQQEMANDWTVILENLHSGKVHLEGLAFLDKTSRLQINTKIAGYVLDKGIPRHSSLKITDLQLQKEDLKFHFDDFLVAVTLNQENIPTHVTKQVKNFSLPIPAGLTQYPFLQQVTSLGYDRLTFGINLNYDYQPVTENVSLAWEGSARDMGEMKVDLNLTDYTSQPLPLKGGPAGFLRYLKELSAPPEKASLRSLKVKYQDQGLVPRLIKAEAQSRNLSAEEFTQNLVGTINTTLLILPVPASIKEQIKAVNRFLTDPEEIQLAINCKDPVPLAELEQGPLMGLVELLGCAEVKISAK
ncbi:MAG: hypothetical protein ACOC6K_01710 [Thermodesulfobacteriota bacterium]